MAGVVGGRIGIPAAFLFSPKKYFSVSALGRGHAWTYGKESRMKALEEKILREGKVLPGGVLKVGGFLNQQIDSAFLMEMGRDIADAFRADGVTKVLTVEASGIAFAVAAAVALGVPIVFAKKHKTLNVDSETYSANVASFTHGTTYDIRVPKEYITPEDRILIVDDFLACGNAIKGLCAIVKDAGATVVGASAAIEKGFQKGGDALRKAGLKVHSLAIVESMDDSGITFRA